jgi:hypothetical protein
VKAPPILLGIGARAQQGKSSFASAILERCDHVGIHAREYSISDEIIVYCVAAGLLPPGTRRHECDPNLLVRIASEKRAEDENFWVNQIRAAIESDRKRIEVAIIPNVRAESEMRLVKSLSGWTVRVTRLNPNGTRFISRDRDANNILECGLDLAVWDFEIVNISGRPFWLRKQAAALLEYLRDGAE